MWTMVHARAGHFGQSQARCVASRSIDLAVGDDVVAHVGAAELDEALARAADGGVILGVDHDDPAEAAAASASSGRNRRRPRSPHRS